MSAVDESSSGLIGWGPLERVEHWNIKQFSTTSQHELLWDHYCSV